MKVQSFKRITTESVSEDYVPIVDSIGYSVNTFAEEVINALNKNITVEDNLNMEFKELEVTVNNNGVPNKELQFTTNLRTRLKGLTVIKIENLTNSNSYLTGAPFVTFNQSSQLLTVKQVTGLISNNKYKITLLLIG
jgi:hypothetical protein